MAKELAIRPNDERLAPYVPTEEPLHLRELAYAGRLWDAIVSHRKVFAAVAIGFVLLTAIVSLLTPKQYTAVAKLIVGNTPNQAASDEKATGLPVLNAIALQSADLSSDTFAELMQEGPVADEVIAQLGLKVGRERLLNRVAVKPVLNTAVLSLSAKWSNPQTAAQIANTFASVFVEHDRNLVRSQALQVQERLKTSIADARDRMQSANDDLARYQSSKQMTDATTATQTIMGRAAGIDLKLDQVRQDERLASGQLANARVQLSTTPTTIAGQQASEINPTMLQLRQQLADAEVALAAARQKYTDRHPTVIALRQQRDQLRAQVAALPSSVASGTTMIPNPIHQQLQTQVDTLGAQVQGDQAQERELQRQRTALAPAIKRLPADVAQLSFLQQKATMAAGVYSALQQKQNDAVVAADAAISDVAVVAPANAADVAVSPNVMMNVAVSIPLGLALACLVVVVLELLQQRMRSDADVLRAVGLPVIAHVPNIDAKNTRALPWIRSMSVEAFLHLCTSLRMRAGKEARTIAITSPSRGDGKSSIAYNVAAAMANIRPPVLIVDADLRYPTIHFHANCENQRGLSDVLAGSVPLDDAIVTLSPGFDALTAGSPPDHPVSLLDSSAFDDLLATIRGRYNTVVVDTTAFVPVADAAIVASRVDATAIVLNSESTNEKLAMDFLSQFRSLGIDNIVGVVLNRTAPAFVDYSDYFAASSRGLPPATA
ncbi:MAG TPA: polysaccharide biosynthesis tyrosine autokinase [Candidatus Tumulicola sp.]|nr:polysaccharide biosynthesis tyrosine autokinase [Candidatus Tumulicola sp.]